MPLDRSLPIEDPLLWGGCTIEELLGRVKSGASRISISGLHGSSLAYLAARVALAVPDRPILVVASDRKRAFRLYEDLVFYTGENDKNSNARIRYYPSDEVLPYSEMLPDRGTLQTRLGCLLQLQQELSPVLVMPAAALIRKVPPQMELSQRSDFLEMAEDIDREKLLERLVTGGYQRVSIVEDRGSFAVRGGTLDIFSPMYQHPVRVELDDQLIESLRFFDPISQRTIDEVEELLLGPVDEILLNDNTLRLARRKLADLADELEYSSSDLRQLLQDLSSGLRPFGIQALMPAFNESLESVMDYLPANALVLMDEPHEIRLEANIYRQRMQDSFDSFVKGDGFAFPPEEFLLTQEECNSKLLRLSRMEHQSLFTLESAASELLQQAPERSEAEGEQAKAETPPPIQEPAQEELQGLQSQSTFGSSGELVFPYATRSNRDLKQLLQSMPPTQEHRLQPLIDRLEMWKKHKLKAIVVCGSKGQAIRLKELLSLYQLRAKIWDERFHPNLLENKLAQGVELDIFLGRLAEGFLFPRARFGLLSEEEIFGPKARKRRAKKKSPLQQGELGSLQKGDLILHREHGMARYGGLHTITIEDITGDFVLLEFQGKDKLYLPITRLGLIEKYSGGGSPSLDKLRSKTFERKKNKVRAAIQAMAGELLQLYASRESHGGFAFEVSDEMYSQFESDFPFQETDDQLRAIEDVKTDMELDKCMDRLICGDVGYGKTEVAMRAAFMAVLGGKQVAVLVPTTVLAQQHGLTFRERMDGYPIRIGVVSRFQTKKEQKELLVQAKEGKVDIIIGTHRLLSRDVHFKDLGLLIIDEEQRFGVRHKERLKQFRQLVDVLTLSATPIPRTLEMAIMGTRDLSLITTPPHDRLAIRTTIAPFNEEIIRETVMRELNRGGQVFFVHNRVESIGKIQETLARIVPEARAIVAHGQMQEGELERVMLDFIQGRFNMLICTSIIESGLDIPRANTILINRADAFGLSQLYQIRGRVGRGRERAYAVLLVPANKRITPEAKQRLETLQRFTELGAGFEIARHDLEMRGAGNLLGKEQSGHIHAIGFDLYLEMLQEAIHELQGKPVPTQIDPDVDLGVDAYIPDRYVPDIQLRLQCYRRLSSAETPEELDDMSMEFVDRFGMQPPEVDALFRLMEIKLTMVKLHTLSGKVSGGKFRIYFHPDAPIQIDALLRLAQLPEPPLRILPNNGIESFQVLPEGTERFESIREFLQPLPELLLQTDT